MTNRIRVNAAFTALVKDNAGASGSASPRMHVYIWQEISACMQHVPATQDTQQTQQSGVAMPDFGTALRSGMCRMHVQVAAREGRAP